MWLSVRLWDWCEWGPKSHLIALEPLDTVRIAQYHLRQSQAMRSLILAVMTLLATPGIVSLAKS